MKNFIILGPVNRRSAIYGAVFRDVAQGKAPRARYLSISSLFGCSRLFYHVLTSRAIRHAFRRFPSMRGRLDRIANRILELPGRLRLKKLAALLPEGEAAELIFVPGVRFWLLPRWAIQELRRRLPGRRLVLYLVDSVDRAARMNPQGLDGVLDFVRQFDAAFTYDRADALRYAALLRHIEIPMWHAPAALGGEISSELYFCGRDKGRAELLKAIHARLAGAGLRLRVDIAGGDDELDRLPGVRDRKWFPYEETVRELLRANCILELLSEDNNESTLRYREAVVYNKKLLTNDANVVSQPYYDPRWMRVLRAPEDIDLDWLRAVEPVDYGYRGEFSAERFLRRVEALTD